MLYTRLAVIAIAMLILGAVGCGSSGSKAASTAGVTGAAHSTSVAGTQHTGPSAQQPASKSGSGTTSSPRKAFVAQADAICGYLNKEAASLLTTSLHTVGTTAGPLASYYQAALVKLHKLTPPPELAGPWRNMIGDLQRLPAGIVTMGRFALANDMAATVKAELKVQKIQQHRTAIARKNGFVECGEV